MFSNSSRINISNCTIYGNSNTIRGSNNTIIGNSNKIYGDNNTIVGNSNVNIGSVNSITGNSNTYTSCNGSITGNSNSTQCSNEISFNFPQILFTGGTTSISFTNGTTTFRNVGNQQHRRIITQNTPFVSIEEPNVEPPDDFKIGSVLANDFKGHQDSNIDQEIACSICFDNGACCLLKPCNHSRFCFSCIKNWLSSSTSCPLCRSKITELNKVIL